MIPHVTSKRLKHRVGLEAAEPRLNQPSYEIKILLKMSKMCTAVDWTYLCLWLCFHGLFLLFLFLFLLVFLLFLLLSFNRFDGFRLKSDHFGGGGGGGTT